jgi:hypothetical protein
MVSVRTSIVPPGPRPLPADTPGASTATTAPQVTASLHDFAVSLALHPTALHCVTGYPCFYPAGYAFDLVVPLINIHQAEFWQPNGHHWLGWAWITGAWTVTALGWFLATLLVVGFSGLARQQ